MIKTINSNTYSLGGLVGRFLLDNDDLNDYYTPGVYSCRANATADSLKNSPTSIAFKLIVELSTGNGNPSQTLIEYNTGTRYYRQTNRYDGTGWNRWKAFVGTEIS